MPKNTPLCESRLSEGSRPTTPARKTSRFERRANDWYVEPAWTVSALIAAERPFIGTVMDPCCGRGTIPDALRQHAGQLSRLVATDIMDRGAEMDAVGPFIETLPRYRPTSVVSNPPYAHAAVFIDAALAVTTDRVCVLLRLDFLGSEKRRIWFSKLPLARIHLLVPRVSMRPNNVPLKGSGAQEFAWFVFEHGYRGSITLHHLHKPTQSIEQPSRHVREIAHV